MPGSFSWAILIDNYSVLTFFFAGGFFAGFSWTIFIADIVSWGERHKTRIIVVGRGDGLGQFAGSRKRMRRKLGVSGRN